MRSVESTIRYEIHEVAIELGDKLRLGQQLLYVVFDPLMDFFNGNVALFVLQDLLILTRAIVPDCLEIFVH